MKAVLWQHREAELIQAAHRIRLSTRNADLWLLTSVPIHELPPTRLLTVRDLFGSPPRVDPYQWQALLDLANERSQAENPVLTVGDVVAVLGCAFGTASKYVDLLAIYYPGWQLCKVPGVSRPHKAVRYAGVALPMSELVSVASLLAVAVAA